MEERKRSNILDGPESHSTQGKKDQQEFNEPTQKNSLPQSTSENASAGNKVQEKERSTKQLPFSGTRKRTGNSRSIWAISGCFVLLIAVVSGVVFYITENAHNVTLYQVGKQQNVQQFVGGGGLTYPNQQFDLSYANAERVVSIHVKAGDHVTLNQPLIQLDPTQLNAQINLAANDVAAAQSYLNSVSGNINQVTVAAAQQQLQVAQNHYNSLVAQASSSTLKNGNLISPLTGTVTAVNINPGEVFTANAILLTIMDQSTVTIRAKIPLSNIRQVKVGMAATVTPSALSDVNVQGTVSSIIQQADPQTDTVEVWVDVKNTQQTLLPGMSAFVRIAGQVNAFSVPRLAVLNPDHNSTVFIERGNKVFQQVVHVVSRSADSVYIDQGLTAGDKVVLIPLDKMHDGQQVTVSKIER
jgi:RND family efflux transporter MFP subunit